MTPTAVFSSLSKSAFAAVLFASAVLACVAHAQDASQPKIFVRAEPTFASSITAALYKKRDPATIVTDEKSADFILEAAPVSNKEESTGSKIARCLFMDCIGVMGYSSVSVRLLKSGDGSVVWAYQVRRGVAGPLALQSLSEAIAKHLKSDFLEKKK